MIYLATPYSHRDPAVREKRFKIACKIAARLIRNGDCVFSPIAHSHSICTASNSQLDGSWETWQLFDARMISACDQLFVAMMPGWRTSKGVAAEIRWAKKLNKQIDYLSVHPTDLEV